MGVDRSPPKPPAPPAGGRSRGGSSNTEKQPLKDLGKTYSAGSVGVALGGDNVDKCGVVGGQLKRDRAVLSVMCVKCGCM